MRDSTYGHVHTCASKYVGWFVYRKEARKEKNRQALENKKIFLFNSFQCIRMNIFKKKRNSKSSDIHPMENKRRNK